MLKRRLFRLIVSLMAGGTFGAVAAGGAGSSIVEHPAMYARIIGPANVCSQTGGRLRIRAYNLTPGKPFSWRTQYPSGKPYPELPQGNYAKVAADGTATLDVICGDSITRQVGVYQTRFFDFYTNRDELINDRSAAVKWRLYPATKS